MIKLIEKGTISSKIAKKVFKELIEKGGDAEKIVKEKGLVQISDEGVLLKLVTEALDNNPQSIEDFKNGKDRAIGFLVGQIMKASKGQANPPMVNKILLEEIKNAKKAARRGCFFYGQIEMKTEIRVRSFSTSLSVVPVKLDSMPLIIGLRGLS